MLAVQADGGEIRTIEGMADADGTLHPMQQAFMENHGLQCGYCTPGMVMAATSLLRENPQPDRGRGAHRARGQPVPLHRLPQHRQVGARRGGRRRLSDARNISHANWRGSSHDSHRRSVDRHRSDGQRLLRKEDPALLTGEAVFTNDLDSTRARCTSPSLRSPYAHARIVSIDASAAAAMPGVVAVYTGADLADAWAAPMPCAWPVTDDMKNPAHYPLAIDTVRYVGDGVAVVLADSDAIAHDAIDAIDVQYEPLRGGHRPRGRPVRPGGHPRGPRHQPLVHVEALKVEGTEGAVDEALRRRRVHRQRAVRPATAASRWRWSRGRSWPCPSRSGATSRCTRRRRSRTS